MATSRRMPCAAPGGGSRTVRREGSTAGRRGVSPLRFAFAVLPAAGRPGAAEGGSRRAVRRLLSAIAAVLLTIAMPVPVKAEESVIAPLASRSLLLDVARAGDRLVAVGERGHILLSDDAGRSWRQVAAPTRVALTAVFFLDDRNGLAVGHDATVLRSGDGGESWDLQFAEPELEQPLMDVRFADGDRGIAVGAYGLYLETSDGGESWEQRFVLDEDFHLNAVLRPTADSWFMAGEFGGLYRSDDGGANWQVLDSPYGGSFFNALVIGPNRLLAFGLQGNLFATEDGGESWRAIDTGTTSGLMGGAVLTGGRIVLVGLGGAVLVSDDGGRGFRLERRADRVALAGVAEAPDGALILVGEAGVVRVEPGALAAASTMQGEGRR